MKTIVRNISVLLCVLFALVSCHRKPLYDECVCENTLLIPIDIDWSRSGIKLQNVSVLFYDATTDKLVYEHTYEQNGNDIQSYVSLPIGSYKAVIFNEQRNEIDYVSCKGHENLKTLKFESNNNTPVRSRSTTTRGYVEQPGDLAVAVVDDINVTADMIVEVAQSHNNDTKALSDATRAAVESLLDVVMLKKNNTIVVTAHIKGLNNARLALADLTNLSDGYFVEKDRNSTTQSTIQFAMNNRVYDEGSNRDGTITATISAFGTLDDRLSVSGHDAQTPIMLDILFKLVDKEPSTEFPLKKDVTSLLSITEQNDGSVLIDIDVAFDEALPDVIPAESEGGSNFGSSVDDWGEIIPVPLE